MAIFTGASARVARIETGLAGVMIAATLAITGVAAIARYLGHPILWADEAAISAMIWATFAGAAALFAERGHMGIDYLPEKLGPRGRVWLALVIDVVVLAAFAGLGWLVWRWFDPVGLIQAGSGAALAEQSFNFIYMEPSQTLGFGKVWVWLILPLFVLGGGLHTAALIERDLRLLALKEHTA